mgnify:CR=1 FL=1
MLRAILFDMGGTLDGNGRHWLDRFVDEYANAGVSLPRAAIRAAFDAAERRSNVDTAMMSLGLAAMVEQHLSWQVDHLMATGACADADLGGRARFEETVTAAFAASVA